MEKAAHGKKSLSSVQVQDSGRSQGHGLLEHCGGVRGDQGWAAKGGIGSKPTASTP